MMDIQGEYFGRPYLLDIYLLYIYLPLAISALANY